MPALVVLSHKKKKVLSRLQLPVKHGNKTFFRTIQREPDNAIDRKIDNHLPHFLLLLCGTRQVPSEPLKKNLRKFLFQTLERQKKKTERMNIRYTMFYAHLKSGGRSWI